MGITPAGNKTRRETWVAALVGQPFRLFQSIELEQPAEKSLDVARAQEPIELPAENSLGVVSALDPIENSPGVDQIQALEPIENSPAVDQIQALESIENSPGVDRALELIEVQALEPFELPTEKSPGVDRALEQIEFPDLEAALASIARLRAQNQKLLELARAQSEVIRKAKDFSPVEKPSLFRVLNTISPKPCNSGWRV